MPQKLQKMIHGTRSMRSYKCYTASQLRTLPHRYASCKQLCDTQIEWLSHGPSGGPALEEICTVFSGHRQTIFGFCLNCVLILKYGCQY